MPRREELRGEKRMSFMKKSKPVTFDDIAKYTHFSKTTISRYFNNPESLTPQNQKIIAEALKKLDYRANKVARILANGKTEFIGILMPDLYHHFFSRILNEILGTYEEFGYKFLVFVGNSKEEVERRYIQELLAYQIEGLLVLSHTIPSGSLAQLQVPVVTIEREDAQVCSVNTDNYLGGQQAAALLADCQCDVLIHVNSPSDPSIPAYGRIRGFEEYCQSHGLPHEVIIRQLDSSQHCDQQLLREVIDYLDTAYQGRKKGVFMANDTLANTFLNLLFRKHGCFPADYQLVGFDNSLTSSESVLPISTIGQQVDQIAAAAITLLQQQMQESKKKKEATQGPIHQIIPPVPLERQTTCRPEPKKG